MSGHDKTRIGATFARLDIQRENAVVLAGAAGLIGAGALIAAFVWTPEPTAPGWFALALWCGHFVAARGREINLLRDTAEQLVEAERDRRAAPAIAADFARMAAP